MAEHESISLHNDLLDCHVDLCSPKVLLRFQDNFDYSDLRAGLIASEVPDMS